MFVRRRPLMRAAVVGGGAYVAGRSMGRRAEQQGQMEADQDERISALEDQQQAPPAPYQQAPPAPYPTPDPPAPAEAAGSPMLEQLTQLSALHQAGVLTDEEFTAAKAKLLGT